jgi:hypothetical protein
MKAIILNNEQAKSNGLDLNNILNRSQLTPGSKLEFPKTIEVVGFQDEVNPLIKYAVIPCKFNGENAVFAFSKMTKPSIENVTFTNGSKGVFIPQNKEWYANNLLKFVNSLANQCLTVEGFEIIKAPRYKNDEVVDVMNRKIPVFSHSSVEKEFELKGDALNGKDVVVI